MTTKERVQYLRQMSRVENWPEGWARPGLDH